MRKKKQNNIDVCYFPDQLLDRLAGIERSPLTIVEAPTGFGDIDAETLCHKAIYLAWGKRQTSICLCAELLLARIAILRGDGDAYQLAVDNIKQGIA